MATLLGSLLVSLGLESGEFKSGLGAAEKQFNAFQRSIEKSGKAMAGLGAKLSVAVTLPLVAIGKASVEAAKQSRDAIGQVDAALASMGKQAGLTSEQLQGLATGIMRKSLFDDDDILRQVTANLLTFGNVTQDVFKRAEQVAVDLSARLGQDLQSSTIQVGKALNNPIKGIAALQRVGVQFTQSQKDQIAAMIKSGQVMDAQRLILSELEKEFGGAAEAARKADPFGALKQSFAEFQEQVGAKLLEVLPAITDAVLSVLDAFNELPDGMQKGIVIAGIFAAAFGPLLVVLGSVIQLMSPLFAVMKMGAVGAAQAGLSFSGLRGTLIGLNATIVTFATSAGGLITILAALSAGLLALQIMTANGTGVTKASADAQDAASKAADAAADSTANLATATGKAREEMLKLLAIQAASARQNIETAKTALVAAKANLVLAQSRAAQLDQSADIGLGFEDPSVAMAARPSVTAVGQGGINTAKANLESRQKTLETWQKTLAGLEKTINAGTITPPKLNVDLPHEPHAKKPPKDRTEEITKRFNDQLLGLQQEQLRAQADLADNTNERFDLEKDALLKERDQRLSDITNDKDLSDKRKKALSDIVYSLYGQNAAIGKDGEIIAEGKPGLIAIQAERDRERALLEKANALSDTQYDTQRDALQIQQDLADSQAERKKIALEILELEYRHKKATLEAAILAETDVDDRKRLQAELAGLNANIAGQRASVARQNETPAERFARDLHPSAGALSEQIDQIKIDGLNTLNDDLADAIVHFKSLGQVATTVLQGIATDLLRLEIRKAIIAPLAQALGLGQGGATSPDKIGGSTKSLEANFDQVLGGGADTAGLTAAGSTLTTAGTGLTAAATQLTAAATALSTSATAGTVTGGGGGVLKGLLGVAGAVAGSINFGGIAAAGAKAVGSSVMGGAAAARKLKFFASGTSFAPGGLAIVGERGPELVNVPRGSQVIPNHELRGMARNDNGRPMFNVAVNGAMSDRDARRTGSQIATEGGRKWAQARKAGLA